MRTRAFAMSSTPQEIPLEEFQIRRVGIFDNLVAHGDYKVLIESQVCDIPGFSEISTDNFGRSEKYEAGYSYWFPPVSITRIHNACVSRTGSVFTEKGVVADTLEGLLNECVEDVINVPSFREEDAVCASSKYGNFNHAVFTSETLPLKYLTALDQQVRDLPSPLYFDQRYCTQEYILQHDKFLRNLNLPMKGLLIEPVVADAVFVPCVSRRRGASRASLLTRHLAQLSAVNVGASAGLELDNPRIYVSRRYANSRVPDNIDLLEKTAEANDFKVIHLENMSIHSQIQAFSSARTIIAEHGAGLINLMFCTPGTRVVELFPSKMYGHWTFRVASFVAGLSYSAGKFEVGDGWVFNKDPVHVPIDLFQSALRNLQEC